MPMVRKFSVSRDCLDEILQYVEDQAILVGLNSQLSQKIRLVVDEAVTNIINHSGLDGGSELTIDCMAWAKGGIKVVIKDRGIPYNPLMHVSRKSEDQLGGFGIHLMVHLSDDVFYQREEDTNILTLLIEL